MENDSNLDYTIDCMGKTEEWTSKIEKYFHITSWGLGVIYMFVLAFTPPGVVKYLFCIIIASYSLFTIFCTLFVIIRYPNGTSISNEV